MSRFGQAEDRHSLVRNRYAEAGQLMDTRRTCSRCKTKRPQLGGSTKGGAFVCAICKNKRVKSETKVAEIQNGARKNPGFSGDKP